MTARHLRLVSEADYFSSFSPGGHTVRRREGANLEAVVASFLANQRLRGLAVTTIKRRNWTLGTFSAGVGDPLTATTSDVETFLALRPTAATRRALLSDLRAFYRWANSRGLTTCDPTDVIESPKVPKRLPTPLTRDELARAWSVANFQMRCVLGLGAGAGLRVSEIAALQMHDLDFTHRTITIRNGKGGKDRTIPMAYKLGDLLRNGGPDGVVPYTSGDSVSNAVRATFRKVAINKRAHDLRATFATEAARASGGNMLIVAQLLGHSSIQTSQRYTLAIPVGGDFVDTIWDLEAA